MELIPNNTAKQAKEKSCFAYSNLQNLLTHGLEQVETTTMRNEYNLVNGRPCGLGFSLALEFGVMQIDPCFGRCTVRTLHTLCASRMTRLKLVLLPRKRSAHLTSLCWESYENVSRVGLQKKSSRLHLGRIALILVMWSSWVFLPTLVALSTCDARSRLAADPFWDVLSCRTEPTGYGPILRCVELSRRHPTYNLSFEHSNQWMYAWIQ